MYKPFDEYIKMLKSKIKLEINIFEENPIRYAPTK